MQPPTKPAGYRPEFAQEARKLDLARATRSELEQQIAPLTAARGSATDG